MPKKGARKRELTLAAAEALVRAMRVGKGRFLEIRPTLFLGWAAPATRPNWAKVMGRNLRVAWDREEQRARYD